MHAEFMRDKSKLMPKIESPDLINSMRIWHCNYSSLEQLNACSNLDSLVIASLPEENFNFISQCKNLRYLSVCHLPKMHDLSSLANLRQLEVLSLETLPSWDGSVKVQLVDSLRPIALLPKLKYVELFGVRTDSKSPSELIESNSIISVRFSKYLKKEVTKFYKESGCNDDFAPEVEFEN